MAQQVDKIYIAGKVTGLTAQEARRNFMRAEMLFKRAGLKVVNPLRLCRPSWSWSLCMVVCLWNLARCRYVAMLSNWRDSRGARIEYKFAKILRKRMFVQVENSGLWEMV